MGINLLPLKTCKKHKLVEVKTTYFEIHFILRSLDFWPQCTMLMTDLRVRIVLGVGKQNLSWPVGRDRQNVGNFRLAFYFKI